MKRFAKVALWSSGVALTALLIATLAGLAIVRTDWFRDKVRERIVREAGTATGGRVEIGAFRFDWRTLTAQFDNLVIHGREAADQAPLLSIGTLSIGLRVVSLMERQFDVATVEAAQPRLHVILGADGSTNIPEPRLARRKGAPETILALKIGRFELRNGSFVAESPGLKRAHSDWNAQGENLVATVNYRAAGAGEPAPRYEGEVSLAPLHLALDGLSPFDATVHFSAALEKDTVTIANALVTTGGSEARFSEGTIRNFQAPEVTGRYRVHVSLPDADRIFKLVNFRHVGTIDLAGEGRFASPRDYEATGALNGIGIDYGPVKHLGVSGRFRAQPDVIDLSALRGSALGGQITATGQIRKLTSFRVNGTVEHFDANDLAGLIGLHVWAAQPTALPYDGLVSGVFDATGLVNEERFHRINATATVSVAPVAGQRPAQGQIAAHYDSDANLLELGNSWIELPASRVEVSGVGGKSLAVRLRSRDISELMPALGDIAPPFALRNGSLTFDGKLDGPLNHPRIAGHAELTNAVVDGQRLESLAADTELSESGIKAGKLALNWGPVRASGSVSLGLAAWKPGTDSAVAANLQVTTPDPAALLALAGAAGVPVSGALNTSIVLSGSPGAPDLTAQFTFSKGRLAGEAFETASGRLHVTPALAATLDANVAAGARRLKMGARFEHTGPSMTDGRVNFDVSSNAIPLAQIAAVRRWQPSIGGAAELHARGALLVRDAAVSLADLDADLATTGLLVASRSLGNARLTATTHNNILSAKLDSTTAQTALHGEASMSLGGQFPYEGTLRFAIPDLKSIATLLAPDAVGGAEFEGAAEGEFRLRGAARAPELATGQVELSRIEIRPGTPVVSRNPSLAAMALHNDGPVTLSILKSGVRVDRARFAAPQTTLTVTGAIGLGPQAHIDLNLQGDINIALAQTFSPDLTASGEFVVNAGMHGTFARPDFSGTAEIRKADFHYAEFTNGLTNANGIIRFNGTRANLQSFSAETGGGRVDTTGFVTFINGVPAFRLEAKAREVRVRYPEGVSSVSDGDLTFAGTAERSLASGRVTIRRVSINPKSDLSTILAASAQPFRTPESSSGLLNNMNFDVQVETAPDVVFQTSVAQRIQADASLRLRGTATNPAVLGRVNITQGELVFFGNKYTINQGAINFFNPAKIDPILNLDLETKARGVDVILSATGPLAKLNVSYRSDPPLQFADIVALLATGRSPNDPTLAVRDTGQSQSLQQIGASALLGEAIANPAAGRLQRFFGVSRIKIDPSLTGVTGSPEARLTVEQQVTPELLFTYVSDVSNTSTQLIKVEWSFNRRWAAVLTRAENGYIDLDFTFKKSFR